MTTMALTRPTRPAQRHGCRVQLTTGPAAAAEARRRVRAAIASWQVPVDPESAVLLTSELVTNAIRHEAGQAVMLVITCSRGRLRVDVHDTSPFLPAVADVPADAETGRGLLLVETLSDEWGCYPTQTGKAVFFTLALPPDLVSFGRRTRRSGLPRQADTDPPGAYARGRGVVTPPSAHRPRRAITLPRDRTAAGRRWPARAPVPYPRGVRAEQPEEPQGGSAIEWGSDALAELLCRLDLRYIALVPGSSYRGLHDSLVNYAGNREPQLLVCLHEEHAVAIAHGFAKVTGRPMAVAIHSNVGLMHATMAIYNAWCDRVPMLIVGATGPVDAARRRPWIDWIHTSADQGALIRQYVKWDDQPASVEAALDSLAQAYSITRATPSAPVYVCLDVTLQEQSLPVPPPIPDVQRDRTPRSHGPDAEAVRTTLDLLGQARRPLFLFGRASRDERDWDRRVALAERYGALVISDLKNGVVFPTSHPLHPNPPGIFLPATSAALIGAADLILSLDWTDLAGTLSAAAGHGHPASARIVSCTTDSALRNGWSKDSFGREPVDLSVPADPGLLVAALLESDRPVKPGEWQVPGATPAPSRNPASETASEIASDTAGDGIGLHDLAEALRDALNDAPACLVRLPLGWHGADLEAAHPLDFLGMDGGAGIGSGPGMAVGAALALEGSGRIGTSSLTEGTRHVAERMLAAHGLTYPADYDFALEGSHVERWKALQAGTIDAALQMIPYDQMAVEAGFTDLGPVTEEFALNAVCVTIEAERAWLSSFLRALAEATEWFRGHVEESAQIAAVRTSIELRYALRACQALAADGVIPRDLRSSPAALAAVTGALRSSGLIPPDAADPIAVAVDYSYL